MNNSIQIAILICSGMAALLVSSRNPRTRMFGFISGLCGQPFWFITSWTNGQWAILLLSGFYTFCHARGIWNNRKIEEPKIPEWPDGVRIRGIESVRYTSERPSDLEIQKHASSGLVYNAETNCFESQ